MMKIKKEFLKREQDIINVLFLQILAGSSGVMVFIIYLIINIINIESRIPLSVFLNASSIVSILFLLISLIPFVKKNEYDK